MTRCNDCSNTLEPDEEETPRKDEHGNTVCDQCFDNRYQRLCPICEENFWDNYDDKISPKHFVITKSAEERHVAKAGFYEVTKLPFFIDGIFEAQLLHNTINRLSDLPKDFDGNNLHYSLYFICDGCASKLKQKKEDQISKEIIQLNDICCRTTECVFENDSKCIKSNTLIGNGRCKDLISVNQPLNCISCKFYGSNSLIKPCIHCDNYFSRHTPKDVKKTKK